MPLSFLSDILLFVVYRLPSKRNKLSRTNFFDEFSIFLEQFVTHRSHHLMGDFNFHVDDLSNSAAEQFLDTLEMFDLCQFVDQPTY